MVGEVALGRAQQLACENIDEWEDVAVLISNSYRMLQKYMKYDDICMQETAVRRLSR